MTYRLSAEDRTFREDFEACRLDPADFDHRGHVRLAYAYLVELDDDEALDRLRAGLGRFLHCHDVDPSKYHETMTRAWLLAVRHFMQKGDGADSADAFIEASRSLLDARIMLTHYSADLLFSDRARGRFVEPDLDPIPRYED